MTLAKMYSFQLVMKTKTEVATSPGATSGSKIRVNAPSRLEPSTIAASSSSLGIPMMNPRSVQTANGSRMTRWVSTSPMRWFVRWYFASATAARNATTIERATTAPTTIRLFFTTSQKYGRAMASRKCCNVGWIENHVGEDEWISVSGLNAVEIIQNTGKTNTRKTPRPTTFQTARRRRRLRARRIDAARGVARATGG